MAMSASLPPPGRSYVWPLTCTLARRRYTALVYFGEAGVDYGSGGATLFVDAAEAAGDELLVGAGLKVEAQKGRMVLFSGGLENVYGRMAMGGWGQHSLMQMWFRCNSTQYGEDERSGKEEL